jgi:hypothetical protein
VEIASIRHRRGPEVHLRLSPQLYQAVHDFGEGSDLGLNASLRLLIQRGLLLDGETVDMDKLQTQRELKAISDALLATLVAVEQSQLLLVHIIPGGEEKCELFWDQAGSRARLRLQRLEAAIEAESA